MLFTQTSQHHVKFSRETVKVITLAKQESYAICIYKTVPLLTDGQATRKQTYTLIKIVVDLEKFKN